jgi:ElaB/YqjD/DUF883 family membrane-anchored ribosome-binding protein
MEQIKPKKTESITDEVMNSIQTKIEDATYQFIETFEESARDVKSMVDREFSQKPWVYFTSIIGTGVIIGYLLGRSGR